MKVFISWSGELSHAMAQALADWLPNVIQSVKPFLSSEDIQKGARWFEVIGSQLEQTHFGVLCLTRSNLFAPWILFEAGALSKQLELARVVPLLVDLKPSDLTPPLSQFNAVVSPTRGEIERLLRAMNAALGDNRLNDTQFGRSFEREWPELEARIKKVGDQALHEQEGAQRRERTEREMIEEILELVRSAARRPMGSGAAAAELLSLSRMFESGTRGAVEGAPEESGRSRAAIRGVLAATEQSDSARAAGKDSLGSLAKILRDAETKKKE